MYNPDDSHASLVPVLSRWPLTVGIVAGLVLASSLLALYLAPEWSLRWRRAEDQAMAEAVYLRRQAELRAETEAAEERLGRLDRRIQLVSLGFREVARKVAPVVVHIGNEVEATETVPGRMFYDFESNRHYVERAEGSGILVKPGYVLTNEHVVRRAEHLRVTFASGRWLMVSADNVSADRLTDLAVIRLPAEPGAVSLPDHAGKRGLSLSPQRDSPLFPAAEFADSEKDVQVGDWVLAAGSPFGLRQTVTAGIVSAKGRVELGILDYVELLQTDAAINPGNSGGPLFDQHGRVIGINVAIATARGHNEGVAFAIPSNSVREIVEELVKNGEVVRGYLGIGMQEIPPGLENRLGVGDTGGVIVSLVEDGSPADRAGIRTGDVIIAYEHEPIGAVNALNRLRQRIARTPPDSLIAIEIRRRHEHLTLETTIAKRKPTRF